MADLEINYPYNISQQLPKQLSIITQTIILMGGGYYYGGYGNLMDDASMQSLLQTMKNAVI